MVEGKWFAQGADITVPLQIRTAVFARGQDALDAQAQQVVVYREGTPVGTARLWWQDGAFRMGDVGVLAQERGQGYGDLLVRLLLYKAVTHDAKRLTLACSEALVPFFARYGFQPVQGAQPGEMALSPQEQCMGCGHCDG